MAEGETSIAPLLDVDQDRTVEEQAHIPEASMEESPEKGITPDDLTPGDGENSPTPIEKTTDKFSNKVEEANLLEFSQRNDEPEENLQAQEEGQPEGFVGIFI